MRGADMTTQDFVALCIKLFGPQSQQCLELSHPPHDIRLYDGSVSVNATTREIRIGTAPAIKMRDLVKELEIKNNNGGGFDANLAEYIAERKAYRRSDEADEEPDPPAELKPDREALERTCQRKKARREKARTSQGRAKPESKPRPDLPAADPPAPTVDEEAPQPELPAADERPDPASLEPDYDEAERHLTALDPNTDRFTFQTFDDNEDRKDGRLAKILHGTLAQHFKTLVKLNNRGAGIFVCVAITDFKGRSAKN